MLDFLRRKKVTIDSRHKNIGYHLTLSTVHAEASFSPLNITIFTDSRRQSPIPDNVASLFNPNFLEQSIHKSSCLMHVGHAGYFQCYLLDILLRLSLLLTSRNRRSILISTQS